MTPGLIGILAVGAAVIGLMLTFRRDARADLAEVRSDLADLRNDVQAPDRTHVSARRSHRRLLRRTGSTRRRLTAPNRAMGVSSPTNTVALAEPTRPARFHVSASHRPPTTCHPSSESVHYPSKPRNPIPDAHRLPRPPPPAASSKSPLPRVRPLPAIPLLTSHPFAFTLSNLTAHFSSLTPSSSRHPGVPSRDPAPTAALAASPVHGEPVEPHPRGEPAPACPGHDPGDAIRGGDPVASNHLAAPSAHGEPFEPHPVHASVPSSPSLRLRRHPTAPSTTPAKAPTHASSHRPPNPPEKRPPAPQEFFGKELTYMSAHDA